MSFFRRIKTSLSADAHGLVDAIEDEALLLKQHLRDAEAEVLRKRARARELEAEQKRLGIERERALLEMARAGEDVDLAVQQGRDDLSRYALKQLLTQKTLLERIDARSARAGEELKELEQVLGTQQVALDELRGRVQTFLSDRESGQVQTAHAPVTEEQVELELLRRKRDAQAVRGTSHVSAMAGEGGESHG
ncbi:MAG TPA: PspA/IM30 family protein [Polyangiaceae bacterium]|nr:PspA/IM30 family protein [Polyangiaceae bacterium]